MSSVTNFVSQFFSLPPKEETSSVFKKSGTRQVVEYLDSSAGVWDFSRVCELFFSYLQHLPLLSDSNRLKSEKISGVFALTGSALSLPQLVADVHTWVSSCGNLFCSPKRADQRHSCEARTAQAVKKAMISTSNLGNTVSQALIFFHDAKLIDLAKQMPLIGFFFNSTSVFSDGNECIQEACKVNHYRRKMGQPSQKLKIERVQAKLKLALLKIAQATSSVAMGVIGLGALAAGVAVSSLPILSGISLGLSTIWLTSKISSYFYEKSLDERRLGVS